MTIGRVICHDPHEYKQSNENIVVLVVGNSLVVRVSRRVTRIVDVARMVFVRCPCDLCWNGLVLVFIL